MQPQRDEPAEGVAISRRCPACGRRAVGVQPACAEHGPIAVTGGDPDETRIDAIEHPTFEGFRTIRRIGLGGFGAVYVVERYADGRRFAVKIARAGVTGAARRLEREIEALRAIGPPCVPAVHGTGTLEGAPYVVMDHIEAPTLAARFAEAPVPMALDAAGPLALAVLGAIAIVHERGRVHGDLKPENILVDRRLGVTLVDVGPASQSGPEGFAIGTTEYMAPEQCDARVEIDARADVYAVGVLLYEMLTGRPPFWGAPAAVRDHHRTRRPAPPSALAPVPAQVEEVILKCLAKRPEDRFERAGAVREAFRTALRAGGAPPQSVAPRSVQWTAPISTRLTPTLRRRRVGLVFFETSMNPIAIQRRLLLLGGELADIEGRRAVALFSHEVGANPARRAQRAAYALVHDGLCARAQVDLAPVYVQLRRDGSKRYVAPIFRHASRFPGDGDPEGVTLSPTAAAVLAAMGRRSSTTMGKVIAAASASVEVRDRSSAASSPSAEESSSLAGRDELLERLLRGAREVAQGGAPTVEVVVGEIGSGKSSVFDVLRRRLSMLHPGAALVKLEGRDADGTAGTIRDLLRQALDLPMSAPPDSGRGLLRERLGPARGPALWPAVALCVGWLGADAPELRALDAAPGALRSALAVAAGEALRLRAAAGRSCFVVIDDVHLADDATLWALDYATLAEIGARLWVCAFSRSSVEQARPGWGARAGRIETHTLGPLDPESAAALCRQLLQPVLDIPDAVVQRLIDRAGAMPLMMVELARGLKQAGIVRRDAAEGAFYVAADEIDRMPDLPILDWLAEREVDALAPAVERHARLMALLGDDITIAEVTAVLRALERMDGAAELPLDAYAGTQRLLAAGLLVERGNDRVAFRHPLLREAIARGTLGPLRASIHLAALEHYRGAEDGGARLDRVAVHAEAAGLHDEAAAAYMTLAARACARHAYLDAELYFSRAIALSSTPVLAALRGRGLMRYRLGRHADALVDLEAAREQAARSGDVGTEVEILLDEAMALDWMSEYRRSEERVQKARARSAALPSPEALRSLIEARLLLGIGRSLHRADREAEAAETLERAAALAAELGDDGYETLVITLLLLGFIRQGLGQLEGAGRALDEAIRLCESHGDLLHLGAALGNRALLHALLGDRAAMHVDFTRVISLGRALGQVGFELVGHFNLGEYLYLMDDVAAAEPHVWAAAATAARHMGGARPTVVALLEARLRLYKGDVDGARAIAADIRAREAEARARSAEDAAMSPSEDVLCAMIELSSGYVGGDAGEAAWDELVARSAQCSVGQEHVEVLEARAIAAARRGRRAEALCALEAAMRAAARIPNVMGERIARRRRAIGAMPEAPPPG